jgi:hypothetical protein
MSSSSFSSNASDEDKNVQWAMSKGPNTIHFAMALWPQRSVVHALEGAPRGKMAMKHHI